MKNLTIYPLVFDASTAAGDAYKTKQKIEISTMVELAVLHKKCTVSPANFKGDRSSKHFESAHFVGIDIDGNCSLSDAISALKTANYPYAIIPSKSNKSDSLTKFHIFIPLNQEVTSGSIYRQLILKANLIFPETDESCIDVARWFFAGTGQGDIYVSEEGVPLEVKDYKLPLWQYNNPNKQKYFNFPSFKKFFGFAHTGMSGSWNTTLRDMCLALSSEGINKAELVDFVMACAPGPLSHEDMSVIDRFYESGVVNFTARVAGKKLGKKAQLLLDAKHVLEEHPINAIVVADIECNNKIYVFNNLKEISLRDKESLNLYFRSHLRKFNVIDTYDITTQIIDDWALEQDVINYSDIKHIAFKEDDCYCFARLDFELKEGPMPVWQEFLSRMTNSDAFCAFQYAKLENNIHLQQSIWLYGKGNDGKSSTTLFDKRIFKNAYGPATVDGLKDLFAYQTLYNKRVIAFNDTNHTSFIRSGEYKKLSGGDPISVNRKYETPFTITMNALITFTSNYYPNISLEKSEQRRIILCEMVPRLNSETDINYVNKLYQERAAFYAYCKKKFIELGGYNGVILDNKDKIQEIGEDSIAEHETLFEELFIEDKDSFVTKKDLVKQLMPIAIKNKDFKRLAFQKFLEDHKGFVLERRIANDYVRAYYGYRLRSEEDRFGDNIAKMPNRKVVIGE
jgi:hypothetical protein